MMLWGLAYRVSEQPAHQICAGAREPWCGGAAPPIMRSSTVVSKADPAETAAKAPAAKRPGSRRVTVPAGPPAGAAQAEPAPLAQGEPEPAAVADPKRGPEPKPAPEPVPAPAVAEPEPEAAPEPAPEVSGEAPAAPVFTSRRERRNGEAALRGPAPTPEKGQRPAPNGNADREGDRVQPSSPAPATVPARRKHSGAATAVRVALFALLAVLIISLGSGVFRDRTLRSSNPDATEQARSAAWQRTLSLASDAGALAAAKPSLGAVLGPLKQALSEEAADLAPGAAASSPVASASPSPASSPAALVAALADSGRRSLADAVTVDGGVARVLAASGTGQLLQAQSLATAAALPAPGLPAVAAAPLPASPEAEPATPLPGASGSPSAGQRCDAPVTPSPGVNSATALQAAVAAELKVVYGYQVATTRLPEPGFSSAMRMLDQHRVALDSARAVLASRCLAIPRTEPGYALAPGFTDRPAAALASLEQDLAAVYGDLVAVSTGEDRQQAIAGLVGAAERSHAWDGRLPAAPGLS